MKAIEEVFQQRRRELDNLLAVPAQPELEVRAQAGGSLAEQVHFDRQAELGTMLTPAVAEPVRPELPDVRRANTNMELAKRLNADKEAAVYRDSVERGLPMELLRASDNSDLGETINASDLLQATRDYLGEVNNAAVSKNDIGNLNNLGESVRWARMSPGERRDEILDRIRRDGYTEAELEELRNAGFTPADETNGRSGSFNYEGFSGARTTWPTLQEWVLGEAEKEEFHREQEIRNAAVDAQFRERQIHRFDDVRGAGAVARLRSEGLNRYTDQLRFEIALMLAMTELYPDWQEADEDRLTDIVDRTGNALGVDVSGVSLNRLRKAGVGSATTDWSSFDPFGLGRLVERRATLSVDELAGVTEYSDLADRMELVNYLEDVSKALRGRTFTNKTIEAGLYSLSFMAELAATGGAAAVAGVSPSGTAQPLWQVLRGIRAEKGILKGLPEMLKAIARTELVRTPATALPAGLNAAESAEGVIYPYFTEDGDLADFVSSPGFSEFATAFTQNLVVSLVARMAENSGALLPTEGIGQFFARMVPQRIKDFAAIAFLRRLATDTTAAPLIQRLKDQVSFSGFFEEYMEEKIEDLTTYLLTQTGRETGFGILDLGQDSIVNSFEDEMVTLTTIVGQSAGFSTVRIPRLAADIRNAYRYVDGMRAMKDRVDATRTVSRSPAHAEIYLRAAQTPGTDEAHITPDNAERYFQTNPEAARRIGIDPDAIAEARRRGEDITLSNAQVLSRLDRAEMDSLIPSVMPAAGAMTVEQAAAIDLRQETEDALRLDRDRRQEIENLITDTTANAIDAGIPRRAIGNYTKIFTALAQYLDENSEADVMEALRKLSVQVMEAAPDNVRGSITFGENFAEAFDTEITLIRGAANASTLVHESAHWTYRMMEALVDGNLANERMVNDFNKLNNWLDTREYQAEPGTEAYRTERQEHIARGFERYLMEGASPNSALASAFRSLKNMLLAVYRVISAVGSTLNGEVRAVFDGMLMSYGYAHSNSLVMEAVQGLNSELLGLSQSEAKQFRDLITSSIEQSRDTLDREKSAAIRRMKPEWRREAIEEMSSLPVYRAIEAIRAEGPLDYSFVRDVLGYGTDIANELRSRGYLSRNKESGKDPVLFAEAQGFESVDALLTGLIDAESPSAFMSRRLAERETELHSEFDTSERSQSVEANVELMGKMAELLAVRGGRQGYQARKAEFRNRARQEIEGMPVNEFFNEKSRIAQVRTLSREMVSAINGQDFLKAFDAAQAIRWNLELMRQMVDAREDVRRIGNLFRRAVRSAPGSVEGYYHDAILDIGRRWRFTERQMRNEGHTALALLEAMNRENVELGLEEIVFPDWMLRGNGNWAQSSYSEVQALADFVSFLYEEGRDISEAGKNSFRKRVAETAERAVTELDTQPKKYHNRTDTFVDRNLKRWRSFAGLGLQIRTQLARAGRYAPGSVFQEMSHDLDVASSVQYQVYQAASAATLPHVQSLASRRGEIDLTGLPEIPERIQVLKHGKWTPEMVVAVALNLGTEKNRQRLRDGYEWTDADLDRIASRLSAKDWSDIQEIWNAIGNGELSHEVRRVFREEMHFSMKLEPSLPFDTRTADGQVIQLQGGYYPLSYLETRANPTRIDNRIHDLTGSSTSMMALPQGGFTRDRVAISDNPVNLSLSVIDRHLFDMSTYVAIRPAMRRLLRVLNDHQVKSLYQRTQGFERYDQLMAMLGNVANPNAAIRGMVDGLEKWGRTALSAAALMLNPVSTAKQLASVTVGMDQISGFWPGAVGEFVSDFRGSTNLVRAKSSLMRNRSELIDIDLKSALRDFDAKPLKKLDSRLRTLGYFPMRFTDSLVTYPAWLAAYNKALNSLNYGEVDAVAYADTFVASTQGSARAVDMTPIQLSALGRQFAVFFSAVSAAYNTLYRSVGSIREGRLSPSEAVQHVFFNALGPTLLSAGIAWFMKGGFWGDDDDRATRAFLRELISSPFAGIPLVRDVADMAAGRIANAFTGGSDYGFRTAFEASSLRVPNDVIYGLIEGAAAGNKGDVPKMLYLWSDAISQAFGIPVIQVYERANRQLSNWGIIEE